MRKEKMRILQSSVRTDMETLDILRDIYRDNEFAELRPQLHETALLVKKTIKKTKNEILAVKEEGHGNENL